MELNHPQSAANPVISWATNRPYWEKYIWLKCLEKGNLSEDEVQETYAYFLQDNKLESLPDRVAIDLSIFLPPDSESLPVIRLKELKGCKNVNAIPEDQSIPFGKLTLIYGGNGSGKSGFGRLLATACFSKGNRRIFPNLKKPITGSPAEATFVIEEGVTERPIQFVHNGSVVHELRRFSVFDSKSVPVHLDTASTVQFTPGQLEVFDLVNSYISEIERLFEEESVRRYKENPMYDLMEDGISTPDSLRQLSASTPYSELIATMEFSDSDLQKLDDLIKQRDEKIKLDVPKKKKQLEDERKQLELYKAKLRDFLVLYEAGAITSINSALQVIAEKEEIVKRIGAEQFDDGLIKSVGSEKWRALILAAKELYDAETAQGSVNSCLLCKQNLTEKEQSLFSAYWEFLENKAESELKVANFNLLVLLKKFERLSLTVPPSDDNQPAIKYLIESEQEQYVKELQQSLTRAKQQIDNWVEAINSKEAISIDTVEPIQYQNIETLIQNITTEIANLADPKDEIDKLNGKIIDLQHRKSVSPLKESVIEYYEYLVWVAKAKGIFIPKRAYTLGRTNLFNQIVTGDYERIFKVNCQSLECNVGLSVNPKGSEGNTLIELKLDFAKDYNPTDILSEGEQKAAALADFLTEVELDKNNCGIIFDDPVTSLDHDWKEIIARRLVEESEKRQVIIFTHDIVFFLALRDHALIKEIECRFTTIRKYGDLVGIIKPELPWVAQPIKDRIGYLKQKWVGIEKMERTNADPDEIIDHTKLWYELLREGWERVIEEKLFNGVVERFAPSIQTLRLKSLQILPEQIKELTQGMTESSKWVHDRARNLNVATPKASVLNQHLKQLEDFVANCKLVQEGKPYPVSAKTSVQEEAVK